MVAIMEGRFQEGLSLGQQAFTIGQRAQTENAAQMFGIQSFSINRELGLVTDAVVQTVRDFAAQYPAVPAWRCGGRRR